MLIVRVEHDAGVKLVTFTADEPLPSIQSWHDRQGFHLMVTGTTGWKVRQPPAGIVLYQHPDSLEFVLPLDWDARAVLRSDANSIELVMHPRAAGNDRSEARDFTPPRDSAAGRGTRATDVVEPYSDQPSQPAPSASSSFFDDLERARQPATIAAQPASDAPKDGASQTGAAPQIGTVVIPEVASQTSSKPWVFGFVIAVPASIVAGIILSARKKNATPRTAHGSGAAAKNQSPTNAKTGGVAEAVEAVIAENNVKPPTKRAGTSDPDKARNSRPTLPATTVKPSLRASNRTKYDTAECAALKEFITHRDHMVRASAARTLGVIATPDAVMLLINFLSDTHVLVRSEAVAILCRLRDTTEDGDEVRELIRNEEDFIAFLASPRSERRHK